ncbi:hypothetical protein [Propionivibrio sp.]|uniref:hypothetical protein n=1 Tax=Propionivibrio sp. TaxID=2212460 RepID=UPI0025CE8FBD|nr:hypothetical protein [Propionivibrio sp.]MBK8399727.1 hypothetical protein [Propionivibrio sp.]MBK8743376.1 hypothetical protein [Propionivibrio sp.]MBK8894599.1 hypothetical protein [Propionivibrio sp.]
MSGWHAGWPGGRRTRWPRFSLRRPILGFGPVLWILGAALLALSASADALEVAPSTSADLQVGDCAMFREGGAGLIFKTPTYWLKGSVARISNERKLAGRCPAIGKPPSAYTHDDWVRIVPSLPCVDNDVDIREVAVRRIGVTVEDWETPWSNLHGTAGWLFRGQFLDNPLSKGKLIDMDARWLERCESR